MGDHTGLTLYIGHTAELKQKDLGRLEIVLGVFARTGPGFVYRLFNSFVKE